MTIVVDNKWRPYIKLTAVQYDAEQGKSVEIGDHYYFDITRRVDMLSYADGGTTIIYDDKHFYNVKESADEIIAACDKLIDDEAKRVEEMAKANQAKTEAAVKRYEEQLKKDKGAK